MGIMDAIKGVVGGLLGKGAPAQAPQQQPPPDLAMPLQEDGRKLWKGRILRAKEQNEPYWRLGDGIRREYLGPSDPPRRESGDVDKGKPVNLIASFVNTTSPQLLPPNPWPVISAKKPGQQYSDGARLLEARERQVFDRVDTWINLHRALLDAYWLAGFVLVGWQPNTSAAVENGSNSTTDEKPDEPFIRHIPYRDILADPDARSIGDAKWIGYRTRKRLSEVQAGEGTLYKGTEELRPWGGRENDGRYEEEQDGGGTSRDKADSLVELCTIFAQGRQPGEVRVIVAAGDQFAVIRDEYIALGCERFPIRMLTFHDVGRFMPASPAQFWLDMYVAYNEFVAEATARAAQAKTLTIVPDTDTQTKIADAQGGQIIVARDSSLVKQIQLGGTAPETWQAMQTYERLVDKISGVTDSQRGIPNAGEQTATETTVIQQSAQTRMGDMSNSVNRFLRQIAQDMGGMLLQHQWQDVPVEVSNNGGQQQWGTFNNQAVPGPISAYDCDFDVSDHVRTTPAVRQKRAQDRLSLLADPNMQAEAQREGYTLSVVEALKDLLEASGERDIQRYLKQGPTPEQQAQQQMQVQQQKAAAENQQMAQTGQAAQVDPAGDNHQVHVAVHRPAADTAPAIAEHLAEHYGLMPGGMGGITQAVQQASRSPARRRHAGPAKASPSSMSQQNEAALTGAAGRS